MAELTINPASIKKALNDFVDSYKPSDVPERFREASGTAFSGGSKKNGGEKGRNAWTDCGQYGNMRLFDGV